MNEQRYTYGETPDEVIRSACERQCPAGYPMTIRSQGDWEVIAEAVSMGIDAHLEALTSRSSFDATSGKCLVHPAELHVLLRRLREIDEREDGEDGEDISAAASLRLAILSTLEIEEV